MVFLFPGVLFRKFYFSGQFGNQFEQGNLLERFLWSLFLSFICLSSVSFLFFFLSSVLNLHPLDNIDFDKITSIFKNLSKNEYPSSFENKNEFQSFLFLIFIIYFISASLGYLVHKLIRILSLDRFPVFKFKNNWHYLSEAYKENGINRKIGDVYTTFVDVLVKNNIKDVLYRGIFNNFILDKENKLENIILSNAYKFISIEKTEFDKINAIEKSIKDKENIFTLHKNYSDKKVFKKSIDGNLLVLSNENIININFTYVKTSNNIKYWKGFFYDFLRVAFFICFVSLVILPFFQINYNYLSSIGSKVVFSITTFLILSLLLNLIKILLKIEVSKNKIIYKDFFLILILISSPYLWIFNILSGLGSFAFAMLILIIFISSQNKNKNKP